MTISLRPARAQDVDTIVALLGDYMQETYGAAWNGSRAALVSDGFGAKFDITLAETPQSEVVAFAAWQGSYDLHNCVAGAEIIDMYVAPRFRGLAVPVLLLASVAAQIREAGGIFVKGQAVTRPGVRELYDRIAVSFPGADCYAGGRAFRALADLAGQPPRFVVQHLPDKAWNREA